MSIQTDIKGWDLIYKLIQNDIFKRVDVLIAFIHLILINNDYRCIGLGEEKYVSGKEKSSELLPPLWNCEGSYYRIRYLKDGKLHILKAAVSDDIIVNFLDIHNLKINSIAFNVIDTVKSLKGETLNDLIPNNGKIIQKVQTELLKIKPQKAEMGSMVEKVERKHEGTETSLLTVQLSHRSIQVDTLELQSRFDIFNYGRSDVVSLNPGQGGMNFNQIPGSDSSRNSMSLLTPNIDSQNISLESDNLPPDYENL